MGRVCWGKWALSVCPFAASFARGEGTQNYWIRSTVAGSRTYPLPLGLCLPRAMVWCGRHEKKSQDTPERTIQVWPKSQSMVPRRRTSASRRPRRSLLLPAIEGLDRGERSADITATRCTGRRPTVGQPAAHGPLGQSLEQRSVNGMSPELREEVACKRRGPLSEIERRSTEEKQRHKIGSCIQLSGGIE
ncbi:hypothetical protein THAOC_14284 [Thalassiosira oceanica]|uniref:Secreted protein n=1 Tax=Thalassiosira oceanica TaxID=159749 RepID=K0SV86_THAOC|nr:hypothetical protein THAOC_14284 [Thalassiosira oceanica]|eukprot:EJK64926.1 hypothetical protein THAOC_14284 [Thalassiosira oceanica]